MLRQIQIRSGGGIGAHGEVELRQHRAPEVSLWNKEENKNQAVFRKQRTSARPIHLVSPYALNKVRSSAV